MFYTEEFIGMDFNFDLVTEEMTWVSEKILDAKGNLVSKADMELETEYVIF